MQWTFIEWRINMIHWDRLYNFSRKTCLYISNKYKMSKQFYVVSIDLSINQLKSLPQKVSFFLLAQCSCSIHYNVDSSITTNCYLSCYRLNCINYKIEWECISFSLHLNSTNFKITIYCMLYFTYHLNFSMIH